MNISILYGRLQADISIMYGLEPQLDISRVPLYEAFWKELLVAIETCGSEENYIPLMLDENGLILDYDQCYRESIPPWGMITLIVSGIRSPRTLYEILVPSELIALMLRFLLCRDAIALRIIRQICLFSYKSKSHEVTKEQEDKAIEAFKVRNDLCASLTASRYRCEANRETPLGSVLRLSRLLFTMTLSRVDWREISPRHGPGAVSDSKRGLFRKYSALDSKTTRLCDKFYPMSEWNVPTPDLFDYKQASYVPSVCKLAIVPKDKRGPRIICTQPTGLMWIQQGQLRSLNRAIESSSILKTNRYLINDGVSSSIKFDKQEQNGSLALESSRTREFATIDLKDASDLVSWGLVQFLSNREDTRFLAASRAMYVSIRKRELVKLHMFAPMGSAMCFPVESLVFWCVAAAAAYVQRGVTYEEVTKASPSKYLRSNSSEVFVFGDDVLVRREACEFVCECFRGCGFIPNTNKTFTEGFYRESCGVDAYLGTRLDIARLMHTSIASMPDAYASIDLANRARALGMVQLSEYLECSVEAYLGFRLPASNGGGAFWNRGWPSGEVGAYSAFLWNVGHNVKIRWNNDLQHWEGRTIIASPHGITVPQDGRCRLFRGLTSGVDEHTVDWLNPDNMQYHLGWVRCA